MDWTPFVRLSVAALLSALIGIDRELRSKPAGLRTNIVVGVAAAAFAYASVTYFDQPGVDESRIASEIVSGIGFLGGGVIFATGGKPHGLTTAAALWGSAAAGLASGVGGYPAAIALVVITFVVLWPLEWATAGLLERRRREDANLNLIVRDLGAAADARRAVHDGGVRLIRLDLRPFGDRVAMEMVVHGTRPQLLELTKSLSTRPEIEFLSEEAVAAEAS